MAKVYNIVTVCTAIRDFLRTNDDVLEALATSKSIDQTITAVEIMNDDVNQVPWIGVYPGRNGHSLQPHLLGNGSWLDTLKTDVVIQAATLNGYGSKAITELELLVSAVCKAIIESKHINAAVKRVMDIQVEYTYTQNDMGAYFPTAIVTVTSEVF